MSEQGTIILIEDNPKARRALTDVLSLAGYQVINVATGRDLLESMRRRTVSVVVASASNPDFNWVALFREIRRYPRTVPVIFTAEKEDLLDVESTIGPSAYAFLPLPVQPELLLDLVRAAEKGRPHRPTTTNRQPPQQSDGPSPPTQARVRAEVHRTLERIKRGSFGIPTLPEIGVRARQLFDEESMDSATVSRLLELDHALAMKVVAVANSVHYGGHHSVDDLKSAVTRLGNTSVARLAFTVISKELYFVRHPQLRPLMQGMWCHSVAAGHAARFLAERLHVGASERHYLLGFIHNVGAPFLLSISEQLLAGAPHEEVNPDWLAREIEREHARFGATVVEKWGVTEAFVNLVRCHHQLDELADEIRKQDSLRRTVLILAHADRIAHTCGFRYSGQRAIVPPQTIDTTLPDLSVHVLNAAAESVRKIMATTLASF